MNMQTPSASYMKLAATDCLHACKTSQRSLSHIIENHLGTTMIHDEPLSPVFEYAEGELLPGIVSIDQWQVCNNAKVLTNSPLCVTMPEQQWSYGILLPLNPDSLPETDNQLILRLEISVSGGVVGIAGVDASLSTLTTAEHTTGKGSAVVRLLISDVRTTRAIFLRTVEIGSSALNVTLFDVSAHARGPIQLAPQRHGLRFDLFVILSVSKTGTQTIEQTLLSMNRLAPVRRVHYLSAEQAAYRRAIAPDIGGSLGESGLYQASAADDIRQEIDLVRSMGGSVAFISGMREPIDRAIAQIFHSLLDRMPDYADRYATGPVHFCRMLSEAIIRTWYDDPHEKPAHPFGGDLDFADWFFSKELLPMTGVDVLRHPIDKDAGYSIIVNGNTSTLLYRFEDFATAIPAGLSALTGRSPIQLNNQNRAVDKDYADIYRDFRAAFRIPADIRRAVYDQDRYVRHFYSAAEIARFDARWSDDGQTGRGRL